ncbi:MAG: DMT family transporter [Desulfovibrionaceae bacterium]|nr:DMT family transporter [Desulfovibrionaceae bacterium]
MKKSSSPTGPSCQIFPWLPHLALLLAMIVWSSSYIALRIALSGLSPVETMTGRMLTACIVFLPLWPALFRAIRHHGQLKAILLMGLCEPCLYFLFETHALRLTTASQAGMVASLLPLMVAVAAWPLLGERIAARGWLGFVLAAAGVVWLSLAAAPAESAPAPLLGNGLEALAMLCAAFYTITARRLSHTYSPLQITAAQSGMGCIFFSLLLLWPGQTQHLSLGLDLPAWAPWASVIYLGACVTFGGYGLYNFGVQRLNAAQAAAYINLIPVITLILGVGLLGEVFLPVQYLASALVIAGLVLSQWRGSEAK